MTSEVTTSTVDNQTQLLRMAEDLFAKQPDWVTFYREILGPKGLVREAFPTRQQLTEFHETSTYHEIQRMLSELRKRGSQGINLEEEPTRVITVRIPKSLHEGLFAEAHEHLTSINKLCISKLLQFIENEMVPQDRGRSGKTQL
ncbi:MAG: toxin-antitoxin system HicB family antitoxin [Pirellulales bacterium]|nr:toxin-antitoxin system HicB family antitoxin [Pirellulales bacterium]